MKFKVFLLALVLSVVAAPALGQGNGKLQIHYMDVGQADGAVLISPLGEVVLFDNGDFRVCNKPLEYLATLGISKIDYMIISHYHADHFGCTQQVLAKYPLKKTSYDRGEPFPPKINDPKPQFARLPCGRKVKIQSIEGQTALVQRLGGLRRGTLAVCPIDKLKPI